MISFLIELDKKIDRVLASLARLEKQEKQTLLAVREEGDMAQADIDALKAEVTKNTNVSQSAVTLIKGLADQIRDLADDPAQLRELATQLDASSAALGNAVAQNTPAPPTP